MIRALRPLRSDRKGATAVEFAMALPLLLLMLVGVAQMGMLFFAHAGLRNLVAEGARFASIAPRPTDAAIKTRIKQGGFGLNTASIKDPVITYGTAGTADFADITVQYETELNFIFWKTGSFNIEQKRRVFIYPES